MNLNLILDISGKLLIRTSKSSGKYPIPYIMQEYKPLTRHITSFIPSEWQNIIAENLQAERKILLERKELMTKWRLEFGPIASKEISKFKPEHPEYFI